MSRVRTRIRPVETFSGLTEHETPERLRALEKGWRERRRVVLDEISPGDRGLNGASSANGPRRKSNGNECKATEGSRQSITQLRRVTDQPDGPRKAPSRIPLRAIPHIPASPPDNPPARIYLPILAHPLPPTAGPVYLLGRRDETITIHSPGSAIEITIRLSPNREIRISHHGTRLAMYHRKASWTLGKEIELQHLTSEDAAHWTTVAEIVERFKRQTPRVKMWTDFGCLTITCSSPPDVILQYTLGNCKVRAVYSTAELRIDTSARGTDGTFKTSRVVPLGSRLSEMQDKPAAALGIDPRMISAWSPPELEAMYRLYRLRNEWSRWML
ncbi:hypothetical protein BD324DRAFT_619466, partial [Kockovaella imperatae]